MPSGDLKTALLRVIHETTARGGRVVIPAFSLGRTQQVVYYLNELSNEGKLPALQVFVDSPLSNAITSVYRHYANLLDEEVRKTLQTDRDPFLFPGLRYITTPQESMELNHRRAWPAICVDHHERAEGR